MALTAKACTSSSATSLVKCGCSMLMAHLHAMFRTLFSVNLPLDQLIRASQSSLLRKHAADSLCHARLWQGLRFRRGRDLQCGSSAAAVGPCS